MESALFLLPVNFQTSDINLLCSPVSPAVSPGSPLRDLLWQLPDASLAADGQEGSVKKKNKVEEKYSRAINISSTFRNTHVHLHLQIKIAPLTRFLSPDPTFDWNLLIQEVYSVHYHCC